jgi:hypothetical protein
MTEHERHRVEVMTARFNAMGIDGGEPTWSSWLRDRLLEEAAAAPASASHGRPWNTAPSSASGAA